MTPKKQLMRVDEWKAEYEAIVREEAELLLKRETALATSISAAEKSATKALYADLLAPVRKRKYATRANLRRMSEAAKKEQPKIADTTAFKLYGKPFAELTPRERKAYQTFCKKRQRLRRDIFGD